MPLPKTNPLDSYVTSKPGNFQRDFKIPNIPRLQDSLKKGQSLTDMAATHDEAMEQFRKSLEQSISERMRQAESVATSATATTTAPVAAVSDVNSVNSKTGDVVLTSDDIAEGSANRYLTESNWLAFFDADGFQRNSIDDSTTVHIPADRNLVMFGPLTVNGILVVDGYLACIAASEDDGGEA